MLPAYFIVVSIGLRLFGGCRYAWGVLKGRARPNAMTWLLWGITPMIAFFAGLGAGLTPQSFVLLALGISPLAIFCVTVAKTGIRRHLTPFSVSCGLFACLGIVLWRITDDPNIAITFSIIADVFASLPTIKKVYDDPSSEYPFPYFLSTIGMLITILCIETWTFTVCAFPIYMLCINIILFSLASFPIGAVIRRRQQGAVAYDTDAS